MDKGTPQNKKQMTKKTRSLLFVGVAIFLVVMALVTIWAFPKIMRLSDPTVQAEFQERIDSFGIWAVLILIAIQFLQVVIAFVPGEPIEVLAGAMYGTWGGLLLCEIGLLLGSVTIFLLVRKYGKKFVNLFISDEELGKYKFLQDTKKLETVTFILFLIPGTPKDALTYLVPLTSLKPSTFFFISVFARIPSIVTSTFAGANLSRGNWLGGLLTFLVIGIIGLLGIRYNEVFIEKYAARKLRQAEDRDEPLDPR